MADRPLDELSKRKIQVTGREGSSYMITLPKQIVENLGWRENQLVTVTQDGDKIIIQDWTE